MDWPWFIASQFVFGVVAAAAVIAGQARSARSRRGWSAASSGGLLMPIPAAALGPARAGTGIWYPVNLLAAMVLPGMGALPAAELDAVPSRLAGRRGRRSMSRCRSASASIFGLLLPRLRPIPATLAWGGLLMPLLWTAVSYGLMGVVNPLLQERVDWPWFIVSQFVFGVVAAIVVVRSEKVYIPPAGRGPEPVDEFVAGTGGEGVVIGRRVVIWLGHPPARGGRLREAGRTAGRGPAGPVGSGRSTSPPSTARTAPAVTGPTASSARRRR